VGAAVGDGLPAETGDGSDEARVVGLESADAEAVLAAVASDTARAVLDALHEEPATASVLADRVDLSLQTVQYHLGKLQDAGLVSVDGTTTSAKGREMDVYGPADGPVVVYAGDGADGEEGNDLRLMLERLVTGVAFLGLVSLLVQKLLERERGAGPGPTEDTAVSFHSAAADGAGAAWPVEPGLLFFAGGLVVLAAYLAVWSLRRRGALETLPGPG
jgi:DNA-binding transcriptional ArsR family regulator